MSDKRTGWLATLKVGEQVAYNTDFGMKVRITRIVAITPSGRIRVHGSQNHVIEFSYLGRSGGGLNGSSLFAVTQEMRDQQHRETVIGRLDGWMKRRAWATAPTERLEALYEFATKWAGEKL
jgi:hypothetical protein